MFQNYNRAQTAGALGMFGAALFFVGLLVEYHYGLFPPGSGTLYVLNQVQFTVAMICMLAMLWQMRGMRVGGNGRFTIFSPVPRCHNHYYNILCPGINRRTQRRVCHCCSIPIESVI